MKNKTMTKKKSESLSDYLFRKSPLDKLDIVNEEEPLTSYNKITNRIYLGNEDASDDENFFKKNKIRAVLNCSKDIPNYFHKDPKIEYLRIPVNDDLKLVDLSTMYKYMPIIVEFIHKHVNIEKNNILVHCAAGRQRSAISVATYLVAKHKLTPKQACSYILKRRPEAFHFGQSLNFDKSLEKYYKKLKKQ